MPTPEMESPDAQYEPAATKPPYPPYRPGGLVIFLLMPILAAVVAIVIAGGGPASTQSTPQVTPPIVAFTPFSLIDRPAPEFTLNTPEGKPLSLGDLRGKWVILNFWATWCQPCRDEMPVLQSVLDGKFESASRIAGGVTVLTVNRQETPILINAFFKELDVRLPVVIDSQAAINDRYGVSAMPTTYFIAPDGVVRLNKHLGILTPKLMDCYLRRMAGDTGDCA